MTVSPAVSQCIYATNSTGGDGSGRVTIYSLNANGNAAPLATISGSETGLKNPQAVAVGDDHSIYVSNYPSSTISDSSITVYQAGASGDAAPVRTITGSDTGLSENYGLAVDRTGKVFVTETVTAPRVAVFDAGADNDEAPSRFFGLRPKARHTLDTSFWPVALDAAGKAYVGGADVCRCGNGADELLVYSKAAHHFQKPLQRIRGGKSQLTFPKGLAVDTSGNVYVANWPNTGQIYGSLLVFASGSNGGAAPMWVISGRNTTLGQPTGVALDKSQEIYVAQANHIAVFPAGSNGDVPPVRTIQGRASGLSGVTSIAIK